ncbi:uncharacterized protein [Littorina saxatilis]|uniref:uncharacterized protein n=1 Tax=Littorina saxatilis TaxID=31220 RepID=UPI0038B620BD
MAKEQKSLAEQALGEKADVGDDFMIVKFILPRCPVDQLDSVLTTLVQRRLWLSVGEALKRKGVSDSRRQWAVMEACKYYENLFAYDYNEISYLEHPYTENHLCIVCKDIGHCDENCTEKGLVALHKELDATCFHDKLDFILPHAADDQLDTVLKVLVERRQWEGVAAVLKRTGLSSSQKAWGVQEACKYLEMDQTWLCLRNEILPHCPDDQLGTILNILVERHFWAAVRVVLERPGVSDELKIWAVQQACAAYKRDEMEHAAVVTNVLPHCPEDQVGPVLTFLVERRLWHGVAEILQRKPVSNSQKRWVVQEACAHIETEEEKKDRIAEDILPFCADDQLDSVLSFLAEIHAWGSAAEILQRGPSDIQYRWWVREACAHASEKCIIQIILPFYVYEDMRGAMEQIVSRRLWKALLSLLHRCTIDTLYRWTVTSDDENNMDEAFWDMVRTPFQAVKKLTPGQWMAVDWSESQPSLRERLQWDIPLCELLCESLLQLVRENWLKGREEDIACGSSEIGEQARSALQVIHEEVKPALQQPKPLGLPKFGQCIHNLCQRFDKRGYNDNVLFPFYFMKHLIQEYNKRKAWTEITDAILVVLTTVPVVPDLQSVALKVMLRHEKWDVIRLACLSHVCEQVRRELFHAAVKQRQWSVVNRWADHTLYDDQRWWALKEAFKEKQWEVYLLLADHGLTEVEVMHVHHQLVLFANWKVVLRSLQHGANVTEAKEVLVEKLKQFLASEDPEEIRIKHFPWPLQNVEVRERLHRLIKFENRMLQQKAFLKKTGKCKLKWSTMLFKLMRSPEIAHARIHQAVKEAIKNNVWHVVIQLVRLGMHAAQRDSLFPEMVKRQRWGVCRALLERGVSLQICLDALPELMERSQWTLVGRVMECNVDDDLRRQVMSRALELREGSVVWKCISTLGYSLSVQEREELFQQAFYREIWQAVKPLIEENDDTGIKHRDIALLEAIEQHLWDVVDHCQRHHADINILDEEGHTPIHRAVRKRDQAFCEDEKLEWLLSNEPDWDQHWRADWEAVKELTVRGADPSLLDVDGLSTLHRTIRGGQSWDAVTLLIQFHGDIQSPAQFKLGLRISDERTALQMLIDARQAQMIETTLMWCPDQWKGVNKDRETALHAVCLAGWPNILYYLVARKIDPMAVAKGGQTALCYAVLCKECPQRMVAECIELGFSAHQPHITDTAERGRWFWIPPITEIEDLLKCPVVLAVMRGLPVVTRMLYESGACSNKQLFLLKSQLVKLTDFTKTEGQDFHKAFSDDWNCVYHLPLQNEYPLETASIQWSVDFLRQVSSTPRSLVSTCRLVISRCLTLSKTRRGDIADLRLSPLLKRYLRFSDLADPDYGKAV